MSRGKTDDPLDVVRRVCAERWDIPADVRQQLVESLEEVVSSPTTTAREKSHAARTLRRLARIEAETAALAAKIEKRKRKGAKATS